MKISHIASRQEWLAERLAVWRFDLPASRS